MNLEQLKNQPVFRYFAEISSIPRGSGNREGISNYCMDFAKANNLKAVQDKDYNVIIYKDGTEGYESAEPIILQGHMDMVCQKEEDHKIDFSKDGLVLEIEDGFIKAKGTTLGADNGIAVAMMLAILESKDIPHPPIEAVFTTDEEIGMLGAMAMDMGGLSGRKMMNLDSEDESVLTVSCAGGSDFVMEIPTVKESYKGTALCLSVKGFRGGHSGVEIDKGRVNATLCLARMLTHLRTETDFRIFTISGGDKSNAIPTLATVVLVTNKPEEIEKKAKAYAEVLAEEFAVREPEFHFTVERLEAEEYQCLTVEQTNQLLFALSMAPNGVMEMSAEIENLVETSLNLGILQTTEDTITMQFALRSSKKSAMKALEEKMQVFATCIPCKVTVGGGYPPWEFKSDSVMQERYQKVYREKTGKEIKVEAIHAGLECGVFSDKLKGLDCISVGPQIYDIHTTKERVNIASVQSFYEIVQEVLKRCR